MKIVTIMGSHRNDKNTQKALDYFISGIKGNYTIKNFNVNSMDINICKACGYCEKNFKKCIYKDDIEKLFIKIEESDIFVIATPVYFNGMSTKMKIIVDRFQMIYACEKYFNKKFSKNKKIGILISVAGAKPYDNQFLGNEISAELIFKNIGADFREHIKIGGTDSKSIEEKLDEVKKLKKLFFDTCMPY